MKRLLLLSLLTITITAMEPKELVNVYAAHDAGNVKLFNRNDSFYVTDDNATHVVKQHDIDKTLKKLAKLGVLEKFKEAGYIKINKHDGAFSLDAKVRGEGGGWLTGQIAAWSVRGVGYGAFAAACFLHPELLLEAEVAHAAIESTALGAEVLGTALPTP